MEERKEKVFADGMWFYKPHENAPDFVKGNMKFNAGLFIDFLKRNMDSDGMVRVDLKKSKGGTLYCELNTYGQDKAKTPPEANSEPVQAPVQEDIPQIDLDDEIKPDSLPF